MPATPPAAGDIEHPRAANFAWNCSNGKFLYWFHNHGGPLIGKMAADFRGRWGSPYDDRNPAWLAAGREIDTPQGKCIEWSQPEILLYDDDPYIRMSYPDLVEDGGKFYVTETQKNVGRVHEIPAPLLNGLFTQWDNRTVAKEKLLLDLPRGKPMPRQAPMPKLPQFNQRDDRRPDHGGKDLRAGFSFDLWLKLAAIHPGQILFDSRDEAGRGIFLSCTDRGEIRIDLRDGRTEAGWESDPGTIRAGRLQHVVVTVDGGPKIITFVVDGILGDGGDQRQFGWGRFSPNLHTPAAPPPARLTLPSGHSGFTAAPWVPARRWETSTPDRPNDSRICPFLPNRVHEFRRASPHRLEAWPARPRAGPRIRRR